MTERAARNMSPAIDEESDGTARPVLPSHPAVRAADAGRAVTLENVGFRYPNGLEVLRGVSVGIPTGEVTAIVGPSGCGKSTLLHLLAGLLHPTSGGIQFNLDERNERHRLAMVFQQDTLLPWLTVRDNVSLYYKYHRSRLLLDEPFSSVDEPTRIGIHQDVLRIVRALNMTTVLVTHDLAEAVSLANQVVILSARPGTVAAMHKIPFEGERDVLTLRDEPLFLEIYGRLWRDLSRQIPRGKLSDG